VVKLRQGTLPWRSPAKRKGAGGAASIRARRGAVDGGEPSRPGLA
jgi:hypothetical protein